MTKGLRQANMSDYSAIADLEERVFAARSWERAGLLETLSASGVRCFVAEAADGDLSGFVMARFVGDEAEILTIGVDAGARRCGVGGMLLAETIKSAKYSGVTTVFLDVDLENAPALALYAKAGFKQYGMRAAYYRDGANAALMRFEI